MSIRDDVSAAHSHVQDAQRQAYDQLASWLTCFMLARAERLLMKLLHRLSK